MGNRTYLLSVAPPSRFRRYALAYNITELFEVHTLYPLTAPLWRTVLGLIHRHEEMLTGRKVTSGTAKLSFMLEGEVGVKDAETPELMREATLREVIRDLLFSRYQSGKSIDYVAHQIEKVLSSNYVARNTEIARFAGSSMTVANLANFLLSKTDRLVKTFDADVDILDAGADVTHSVDVERLSAFAEIIHSADVEHFRAAPEVIHELSNIVAGAHYVFSKTWDSVEPDKLLESLEVVHIMDNIKLLAGQGRNISTPFDVHAIETLSGASDVIHLVNTDKLSIFKKVKQWEDAQQEEPVNNGVWMFRDALVKSLAPGRDASAVVPTEVGALAAVFRQKEWKDADYSYLIVDKDKTSIPEGALIDEFAKVKEPILKRDVELDKFTTIDKFSRFETGIIEQMTDVLDRSGIRDSEVIRYWSTEISRRAVAVTDISLEDANILKTLFGREVDDLIDAVRSRSIPDAALIGEVSSQVFHQVNAQIIQPVQGKAFRAVMNALVQNSINSAIGAALNLDVMEEVAKGIKDSRLEGIVHATTDISRNSSVLEAFRERVESSEPVSVYLKAFKHVMEEGSMHDRILDAVKAVSERADVKKQFDGVISQIESAVTNLLADAVIAIRESGGFNDIVENCVTAITERAHMLETSLLGRIDEREEGARQDIVQDAARHDAEWGKYTDEPRDGSIHNPEWGKADLDSMIFEAIAHTVEKSRVDKIYECVYNLIEGATRDQIVADSFLNPPEVGINMPFVKDTFQPELEWASYQSTYDTFKQLIEQATVDVNYDATVGPAIEKAVFSSIVAAVTERIEKAMTETMYDAFAHEIEGAILSDAPDNGVIHETEVANINSDRLVGTIHETDTASFEGTLDAVEGKGETAWYSIMVDAITNLTEKASKLRKRRITKLEETDESSKVKRRLSVSLEQETDASRVPKRQRVEVGDTDIADRVKKKLPTVIEKDSKGVGIPEQPKTETKKGWTINGKPFSWSFWPWSKKR